MFNFTHACYSSKVPVGNVVPEKKTFCYRTRSEISCCVRTVICNSFHNLGFWALEPSCFGTLLTVAIADSSCSGNLSSVAIQILNVLEVLCYHCNV